ncbi:MAG: type II toxin-antitoxin system VapC family toxin [Nitrospirota bacterium]
MAALFVDTSALVQYYYPEKESKRIEEQILSSQHIYISGLSITEMASALMKKIRNRELAKAQEMLIWNTFMDDLQTSQIELIFPEDGHYFRAADIIREFGVKYGIKTLDALQLATAHGLSDSRFLCTDKVLSKLAVEMGIRLV